MVHIGSLIQEKLDENGMKITEFARRIGKTSSNIYNIFERESIDTALLASISSVLGYDFFKHYLALPTEVNSKEGEYHRMHAEKPTISITINNIDEKKIGRIFRKLNEIIQ